MSRSGNLLGGAVAALAALVVYEGFNVLKMVENVAPEIVERSKSYVTVVVLVIVMEVLVIIF